MSLPKINLKTLDRVEYLNRLVKFHQKMANEISSKLNKAKSQCNYPEVNVAIDMEIDILETRMKFHDDAAEFMKTLKVN